MGRLRQGSVARRVAVSLIALYALILQSFAAAAAPPSAFDSLGGLICAQDISDSQTPGGEQHRSHGPCCILACAASVCAYVAAAFGIAIFPARKASAHVWALTPAFAARQPVKYYFAARGPPQDL